MSFVPAVTLCARGVLMQPLELSHEEGLKAAAADGALWNVQLTSVPEPAVPAGQATRLRVPPC